ncbi:TetR/AcrR family transcriptional regulator [Tundrisphaera sp. TA3]|uniref:TetR/AcrR family transcriptional regulator n=1 Tax=Tundrisphaera sp. TA3 TaxID=3435775 RepID=UPI003EC017C1
MTSEAVRVRNPEKTKRAVLDAAERLFADRGFDGTSLREISRASSVSQPLIQHHFGSKEQLHAAVIERSIDAFVARFPESSWTSEQTLDLRAEMTRLFAFWSENQAQLRIFGWSRLEGRSPLLKGCSDLRWALVRRIEKGQELGVVRRDLDAIALSLIIEGVVFAWLENRSLTAEHFPTMTDAVYLETAIATLERGFAPA